MKITRRSLMKAGVAAGVAGAVTGTTRVGSAKSSKGSGGKKKGSVGPFGYVPFSATFGLPPVLNASTVDPVDGTIHNGVMLDPQSGTPEAAVGSDKVYHGYAPEYLRTHPVHDVANSNMDPEEKWDRFSNGVGVGRSEVHYQMSIEHAVHEFIPGIQTHIFGYAETLAQVAEWTPAGAALFASFDAPPDDA